MTDFVETILIAALLATLFFGGWQVPYLQPDDSLPLGIRLVAVRPGRDSAPDRILCAQGRVFLLVPFAHRWTLLVPL